MNEEVQLHSFGITMLEDEYVIHMFDSIGAGGFDSPQRASFILTPQRLIFTSGAAKEFSLRAALLSDVPYLELRHSARQMWLLLLGIGLLITAFIFLSLDGRTFGEITDDPFTWQVMGAFAELIGAVFALVAYFAGGQTELATGSASRELAVKVREDRLEDARDFIHAFFVAKMNLHKAGASS